MVNNIAKKFLILKCKFAPFLYFLQKLKKNLIAEAKPSYPVECFEVACYITFNANLSTVSSRLALNIVQCE